MGFYIQVRVCRIQSYLGFIRDSLTLGFIQNSCVFTSTKYYTRIILWVNWHWCRKKMVVPYFETLPERTQANNYAWYDRILSRLNKILHNCTYRLNSVVYWDMTRTASVSIAQHFEAFREENSLKVNKCILQFCFNHGYLLKFLSV